MTPDPTKSDRRSREEDYRDYESRDVEDGWPYADKNLAPGVDNPDYGRMRADVDENTGFRVSGIDGTGNQNALRDNVLPTTDGRENSDDLEERVTDVIAALDGIATDAIEVHADGHVVTLTGKVDDPDQLRRVERAALSVEGVRHVRNQLNTLGVDSHMPDEE